ncbi:MAG: LuxR C-terminal-related transcriptional regulator, partial [Conexibacteraceae bacterium]|nr:LuxR C-terminal-related transcriptional regulator [Conexibacteraceae bacterium]
PWLVPRPGLFELLAGPERVVHVSAPAGSGKTFLLRSWIAAEGLEERTAWVSVARDERDPQVFWLSVLDSLRGTRSGAERVRELTPAPDLGSATVVARLLEDLSSLDEPLWLMIDDLNELQSEEAIRHLELLLGSAPLQLRFVLLTRRDLRLGLHRLRVEGQLTEIRGQDLRFSLEESRALFGAAGVRLSDGAVESLVATTEGWAAGLRLAALSLGRDPDPERLAASFSGRERAVADYLLAEVLERQPQEVTRLLLRTSILERVSGPLADRLTGCSGSERILWELEDAGAFVVALDAERSWFRYHRLFADLLALELRRTAPQELHGLHTIAAEWLAEHGHPEQAIRHAQAAENWGLATRLLADSWFGWYLDGRLATARQLLSSFPAGRIAADPELAALAAGDRRAAGLLPEAERYLALAERNSASVPEDRRGRFQVALAHVRLGIARARNDLEGVGEAAQRLLELADGPVAIEAGVGDAGLRTEALIDLGAAEMWAGQFEAGERHLERGLEEARRIGRPSVEIQALSDMAFLTRYRDQAIGEEWAREAIELARAHGWEETLSDAATAYLTLGGAALWRGQLDEAEQELDRAELVLQRFAQPTSAMMLHAARAMLEFARGRHEAALSASRAAESIQDALATQHILTTRTHAAKLEMLVRVGEIDLVRRALDDMDEDIHAAGEMRVALATLRLAQDNPDGAAAALEPIFAGVSPMELPWWEIQAVLLKARAEDALGDTGASSRALERALDLAEPGGWLLPFVLHPAPELLERHLRLRTTHASLISEILNLLSGHAPMARPERAEPLEEPLSQSELRVLRYLPTNLRAPEIASELFVSLNTIRTHMRNVYAKLGVHSRADAVKRARDLGLLAPPTSRR